MFFLKKLFLSRAAQSCQRRTSRLFSLILLFVGSVTFGQTNFYVSSAGNDNNNGTSAATPFQTLNRINNQYLQPGDSILFRRGDTFRGTLYVRRSGSASQAIVYDAYGSGKKPVLAGSVPVTNWTNIGGNVWQANCSSCGSSVTGLYRNGVTLPLGRYPNTDAPNKGNLYIRAHTDKYQIFSREALPDNIDFDGAEVVLRPTAWILDKAIVDHEYHPDVLNIFYNSNYSLRDGSEYFFQNHPGTLDRNGEWCYNANSKNLLVYDSQGTPNNQLLTATTNSRSVDIAYVSYVTLRNLNLTQTLNTTLFAQNVSNLTLKNLDISNSGEDGISILGSGNTLLIEGCKMNTVNNNGILIDPYQNVTLRGNTIRSIGTVPGRGKPGDGMYNGVQSYANQNVLIENNVIDSVGYNGITFGNNTTIRQNVISEYCYCKVDGGGIYAWNGNKNSMSNIHILSNILYTNPNGGALGQDYSIGIFLDDCVENVDIRNNTIFNNTQWGVFLHGANNITFTDNTLFNNATCQFSVYHNNGICPVRNDVIKRNIFFSKLPTQLTGQYESNANDLIQYGAIDSNYYARPFDEQATILAIINSYQGGRYELKDWKNFSGGQDTHSKSSPITYSQYKADGAVGGTSRINTPFETGVDDWYLVYSNYNNAAAILDNTNKLDGNSLRVAFTAPSSQTNSYAQAGKRFGTITKGKTYVLRFDAVASTNVNLLAYLRTSGPPYQEYDRRYSVAIGTTRKSYEFLYTATDSNPDAILLFQIDGEGPVFWLDNVRLQEITNQQNDPNELIKFYYNPTLKDTVVALPAGNYRDVKNQVYSSSVTLKPYTSVILLRDTLPLPLADLSLSLQTDKRLLKINEPAMVRLRVSNQGTTLAGLARWTYRLPANIQFIDANGQPYSDNVLTGSVQQLPPLTDTTFTLKVRPTTAGLFRMAAQLTTATSYDPDSRPNTGTADGEDDAAQVELQVGDLITSVFESPNPNQRLLPSVASNQPTSVAGQADLSLHMNVSRRIPLMGDVITCTVYVHNTGGSAASSVQVQNLLPDGFELVSSSGWTVAGRTLTTTLSSVAVGATVSASFQVRVTQPGVWINQAQISASGMPDPDSTPGNGYTNGEDDRAQVDVRGL